MAFCGGGMARLRRPPLANTAKRAALQVYPGRPR
jgi:hypothetical protein